MTPLSAERVIPEIYKDGRWFFNQPWIEGLKGGYVKSSVGRPANEELQIKDSTIRFKSSGHIRYFVGLDGNNVYYQRLGLYDLASNDFDDYTNPENEEIKKYFKAFSIETERHPSNASQIRLTNTEDENWIEVAHADHSDGYLLSVGLTTIIGALMVMPSNKRAFYDIEDNGLLIYGQENRIIPVVALPGHMIIDMIVGLTKQEIKRMGVERGSVLHEVRWDKWGNILIPSLINGDWKPVVVESVGQDKL